VLERILPSGVVVVDAFDDDAETTPYPEEMASVEGAVEKRRLEFVTARGCARRALVKLGLSAQAIPAGGRGEPRWPEGVVGSITHCDGYRACALGRATELLAIGIDAEVNEPLPEGVLDDIALPQERSSIGELAREVRGVNWDRLLFSIKESVYKAWFPLMQRWLGFEDAVVAIDGASGTFSARLLVPGPRIEDEEIFGFQGRWLARDSLLLAAIAMPARVAGRRDLAHTLAVDEDCP
jgi:4'-phosphopantetheinyl transferase EntD